MNDTRPATQASTNTTANHDDQPWATKIDAVLEQWTTSEEHGLKHSDVKHRQEKFGRNQLRESRGRSLWAIFFDQFESVVIILLAVAAVLALLFQRWAEGVAISAVLLINAAIGFVSEWQARQSMEALRKMSQPQVRVRRDREERMVPSDTIVPGDIVIQEGGDVVPADLRLIEANNLSVDESPLTGESVPATKRTEPVPSDTPLADRSNMLYKGTTVVEGSCAAVVVATGMHTELGRISKLVDEGEKESTPLQQRLDRLGARLAWITIGIATAIAIVGLLSGKPVVLMIETAIALGVAAIPEGLPIVATIALARGMWIMAGKNVLINRLPAVETLGATGIIFTDKTGTLTRNKMTLQRIVTHAGDTDFSSISSQDQAADEEPLLRRAIEIGVLCNNATLRDADRDGTPEESQGDPTEAALLHAGHALGIKRRQLLDQQPEVREVAFDADRMMMATFHESAHRYLVAVKGAPHAVLEVCESICIGPDDEDLEMTSEKRRDWEKRAEELASEGLRLLAVAEKIVDSPDADPYGHLRFVGLTAMFDPPSAGVADTLNECTEAGIRVVMVTGDQPETARAIGAVVGINEEHARVLHGRELRDSESLSEEQKQQILQTNVFARVSPEQKLNILKLFQEQGNIVAMTGDGINDAPALQKADIGVAMGQRGTDAAREAADMVLKDDEFSSIVAAVKQGRIIFSNIRKSVMFMLCTNVAEVIAVSVAAVTGLPLPLRPLQILYLNVLTDVYPALALGVGPGPAHVMRQPPRAADEDVLTIHHWLRILGWSVLIAASVLGALIYAQRQLAMETDQAVTISFLTLAFSKLWFVLNLRDRESTLFDNDIFRNPWIWGATALCIGLLLLAVLLPPLANVLETTPLSLQGWSIPLLISLFPVLLGQVLFFMSGRKQTQPTESLRFSPE